MVLDLLRTLPLELKLMLILLLSLRCKSSATLFDRAFLIIFCQSLILFSFLDDIWFHIQTLSIEFCRIGGKYLRLLSYKFVHFNICTSLASAHQRVSEISMIPRRLVSHYTTGCLVFSFQRNLSAAIFPLIDNSLFTGFSMKSGTIWRLSISELPLALGAPQTWMNFWVGRL